MPIEDAITVEASIERLLESGLFMARLPNGHQVVAHCRSRDQAEAATLRLGDGVRLEMTPFDMSKGRILFKKNNEQILK